MRLTLREFKKNWFQYLSMFLITVLAVTLFLGFLSNTLTLRRRAELYLEATNVADLIVQTSGFDDEDRAFLAEDAPQYRIYSEGSFLKSGSESESVKFYVSDGDINVPYIVEGEEGFLVDERVAAIRGYAAGDVVTAEFASFESAFAAMGLSCTFEFEITGVMHAIDGLNIYSSSPVVISPDLMKEKLTDAAMEKEEYASLFTREAVEKMIDLLYPQFENQALIRCDDSAARKSEIQSYYAEKETLLFVYDRDTMEAVATLDSEVSQSLNMIYVFPVIFFLVALLVILSTVSRMILRERINIGTFKALGISDGRIVVHYALTGTFVTLLGCIAGAVLGPVIVPNVMGIKYTLMFSMPALAGVKVSVPYTVATVLFVCLCAFLIGVWASHSVIRENPAECMRPKAVVYRPRAKERGRDGHISRVRLSLRMAMRNVRINWGRSLLTVFGILGCSALLVTSFGIGDTLNASVTNDIGGRFRYDVSAGYSSAQEEELFAALDGAVSDGTAERYERVKQYLVTAHGEKTAEISVWVFEPSSQMADVPSCGLSESTAEDLGLGAGDEITLTIGNQSVTMRVETLVGTSVWNGFFVTEDIFEEGTFSQNFVWVKTGSPEEVKLLLDETNGAGAAQTLDERLGEINNLISSTTTMKYTLMVFAVLLSVVVLYNLSLLNMKERARDMATLKVLGYTNFEIALSLIAEIMLLTAIGTALGTLCGFPLLMLVMKINEISILAFAVTLYPVSYVLSVLISLVTGAVINLLFSLHIRRIDMTESLKSVE